MIYMMTRIVLDDGFWMTNTLALSEAGGTPGSPRGGEGDPRGAGRLCCEERVPTVSGCFLLWLNWIGSC